MLTLGKILKQIEGLTGMALVDLPIRAPFGSTALWQVMESVTSSGENAWNAIDLDSGEVKQRVEWHVSGSEYLGFVVFFDDPSGKSLFVALPEASSGMQFGSTERDLFSFDMDHAHRVAECLADLDFADLGGNHGEWSAFIGEWQSLVRRAA